MTNGEEPRVIGRLSQYRRRQRLIAWVGGGLLAEITIYAAIRFNGEAAVPTVLTALVPTLVLLGGLALAWARAQFEWRADLLQRHIEMRTIKPDDLIRSIDPDTIRRRDLEWPQWAEFLYILELFLAAAAAVSLLLLIWWPFIDC